MPKEYNEIELPRFARRITFTQGRNADIRSDDTDITTGILAPFAGVLNRFPPHGYWQSPNLSYLILQPLIVRELTETVQEVHPSIQPTSKNHRTDATPERTVFAPPPSIFRPTTRVIERRTVEEQISVDPVDEPKTERLPPMRSGDVAKRFENVDHVRPSPLTPLPELRVDRRVQTADSEATGSGVLHRPVSTQQVSRGQDRRMGFENGVRARRTFLRRRDDVSLPSVSRLVTPGRRVDGRTIIDLDRRIDQTTPSERLQREGVERQHMSVSEFRDVTPIIRTKGSDTPWRTSSLPDVGREVLSPRENVTSERPVTRSEPDGTSDSRRPDAESESRVRERLVEPSEQADQMTVLETIRSDDTSQSDKASAQPFNGPSLRTASANETAMDFSGIPSPLGLPIDESRRSPKLTFKKERTSLDTNDRAARESGHPLGATSEHRRDDENDNQPEKHISSLPSTDNRHTDPEIDLDRLVDRLFTKFERKMRMERERRGL